MDKLVSQLIQENKDDLKEAKIDEFRHGLRPNGQIIGHYSNSRFGRKYRLFKIKRNPLAKGNVDLIFEGNFTRGLFLKRRGKGFVFDSRDSKTGELVGKYGADIMDISQRQFNDQKKRVYERMLAKKIKKYAKIS